MRVYPRVCGGTSYSPETGLYVRAIGKAARIKVYPRVCGGTSVVHFEHPVMIGVYPRVCGGTCKLTDLLSPWTQAARSIPACAGAPGYPSRTDPRLVMGLSPRVRGHRISVRMIRASWGLSPRVRGHRAMDIRFMSPLQGLSPRVRGHRRRDIQPRRHHAAKKGLSPRVRGHQESASGCRSPRTQVYPRVCGGTTMEALPDRQGVLSAVRKVKTSSGLSPRVRGHLPGVGFL